MSNFKQNTVETVGDAALAESIIDRSITELQDDITMSIAAQKFRGCSGLTNVIFPNVASVGVGAFWQCTALKQADFSACVSFAQNAFYGCSALKALILRCTDTVCSLTGNLSGTKIASGTGYVYVPSALVDAYKAASGSGWSIYASQIRAIEDYPAVCDKYTWEGVFAAIDAGTYATDYAIGDTVPLDLGSEGVVNMQIAAFDADDKADGSGKAPISWISQELLATKRRMNPQRAYTTDDSGTTVFTEGTGTFGGWEKCEMRTYLDNTIKLLIPENVRNKIVPVSKTQPAYNTASTEFTQTTEDTVWIPSKAECFGSSSLYFSLFANTNENRIKAIVDSSNAVIWHLRSAASGSCFDSVSNTGSSNPYTNVQFENGIAIGFCT